MEKHMFLKHEYINPHLKKKQWNIFSPFAGNQDFPKKIFGGIPSGTACLGVSQKNPQKWQIIHESQKNPPKGLASPFVK